MRERLRRAITLADEILSLATILAIGAVIGVVSIMYYIDKHSACSGLTKACVFVYDKWLR